jgi:K+-sensing histidine kinase KdpD
MGGVHHGPVSGERHRLITRPDFAWWPHPPMILRYAVAGASVTAAITSQRWMEDHWAGAPAALALCAVIFSAWFGGLGPSLLAMALAILLFKYFFVIPVYSLAVDINEESTSSHLCVIGRSGRLAGGSSTRGGRIAPARA